MIVCQSSRILMITVDCFLRSAEVVNRPADLSVSCRRSTQGTRTCRHPYTAKKWSVTKKDGRMKHLYRLHVKSLLQLPHDVIDVLLQVRPSAQVSFMLLFDTAPRKRAHVASRSSLSRADGGIVAETKGTRDIL